MKKLFYSLMIAAATFMAACGPVEEPNGPNKPNEPQGEKPFYGFMMDDVDVYGIGGDDFIVQMYILDQESGATLRLMSAQTVIPNVGEDGVLPEGTYELVEGNPEDGYITGSFYENNSTDAGYAMIISEGELEVKHTAQGTRLTVRAKGYDAETNAARDDVECRYVGNVQLYGTRYTGAFAGASYKGVYEGVPYWLFQIALDEEGSSWFNIYVNTDSEDFEAGIPSGKYPFNLTFASGNADATYVSNGQYAGSMLLFDVNGDTMIGGLILGGYVEITNNGETYTVDMKYYNQSFVPHTLSYEGAVKLTDDSPKDVVLNVSEAAFAYKGDGYWKLEFVDEENEMIGMIDIYCGADNTFADGIPAGTYTVSASEEAFTVGVGVISGGSVSGSLFAGADGYVADVVLGGEMVINADMTFSFNFEGYFAPVLKGAFEGTPEVVDTTAAMDLDYAQYFYVGGGCWYAYLGSTANDAMFVLEVYCAEDNTFADGIPAGTYNVADTYEAFTIGGMTVDEEGYYGSMVMDMQTGETVKDFIMGGKMEIAENGAATIDFVGYVNPVLKGATTVEPIYTDATAAAPAVAPAKAAMKAPVKKDVKNFVLKERIDKNTTYPYYGVMAR